MKQREALSIERVDNEIKRGPGRVGHGRIPFLSAQSVFGMNIDGFAAGLAEVTMLIARGLPIDELHITARALPPPARQPRPRRHPDRRADRAGTRRSRHPPPWPKADVIV